MLRRLESLVMDSRRRAGRAAPTEPNELEPAHLLHGANHSPPEFSAALLADQLTRFAEQAERRAAGVRALAGALAGSGWEVVADEAAVAGGTFYGILLRVPAAAGTPADVIARVERTTGLVLSSVYPPVPEGPLYRPETIKQFTALRAPDVALPHSRGWSRDCLVVPHQAFLATEQHLRQLAEVLRDCGSTDAAAVFTRPAPRPVVDVVVITRGERDTLAAALTSVGRQDVDAEVRLTVWVDAERLPAFDTPCSVVQVARDDTLPKDPFGRIAVLREHAASRCTGDFVAFLDDDNEWMPEHLSTLLDATRGGRPFAHSWRTLVGADGAAATVTWFPWLAPSETARSRLDQLREAGVMSTESPVVRDQTIIDGVPGMVGMVDMGEWLFDRNVLRLLTFSRPRTAAEIEARHGEDDVILEQIHRLEIPVACTARATLRYRLGGMSTPEHGTETGAA
jgi:hypothetical protein